MQVTAIVPAAGSGVRMQQQQKKPYILLDGMPLLGHTLRVLDQVAEIDTIIISVFPGEEAHCRELVVTPLQLRPGVHIIAGGAERQDSVGNALAVLPDNCDVVLIHDGARPFVTPDILQASIAAACAHGAATAAVPVKDTITRASADGSTAEEPLPRERLYAVQTPQTFRRDVIMSAHAAARRDFFRGTDDASLVQHRGLPVAIVPGSCENIKITTVVDLTYAAAILHARRTA